MKEIKNFSFYYCIRSYNLLPTVFEPVIHKMNRELLFFCQINGNEISDRFFCGRDLTEKNNYKSTLAILNSRPSNFPIISYRLFPLNISSKFNSDHSFRIYQRKKSEIIPPFNFKNTEKNLFGARPTGSINTHKHENSKNYKFTQPLKNIYNRINFDTISVFNSSTVFGEFFKVTDALNLYSKPHFDNHGLSKLPIKNEDLRFRRSSFFSINNFH